MKKRAKDFRHGQAVRIQASLDGDAGNLRGMRAEVLGVNATFDSPKNGPMVNVRLEDGTVCAVPQRAVKARK